VSTAVSPPATVASYMDQELVRPAEGGGPSGAGPAPPQRAADVPRLTSEHPPAGDGPVAGLGPDGDLDAAPVPEPDGPSAAVGGDGATIAELPATVDRNVALDDADRLGAVDDVGLLDEPVDAVFDRATRVASMALGTPVALVSLVTEERQFFAAQTGLDEPWASVRETPLTHSFCQHVVVSDQALVVTDAREDDRVVGNLAIDELGVVAYLGVPVRSPDGRPLGAFCVIDSAPRTWNDDDLTLLRELAASVQRELDLRAALTAVATANRRLDDVLAALVHDLTPPVRAVLDAVTRLRHDLHLDVDDREMLYDHVLAHGDRAEVMLASLLARRTGATPEDAPVDYVVSDVAEARQINGNADRLRVHWDLRGEARLPLASFHSIVSNLVGDALAHGRAPVDLALRVTLDVGVELDLVADAELHDRWVDVDEGPVASATGAIACIRVIRRRVDDLGGRLEVARTDDGRSQVTVRIPATVTADD
jgi:GAF domain-containing protein